MTTFARIAVALLFGAYFVLSGVVALRQAGAYPFAWFFVVESVLAIAVLAYALWLALEPTPRRFIVLCTIGYVGFVGAQLTVPTVRMPVNEFWIFGPGEIAYQSPSLDPNIALALTAFYFLGSFHFYRSSRR